MLKTIILAGGIGSRLWPVSKANNPKQFQKIASDKTMFYSTLERIKDIDYESFTVITNEEYKFFIQNEAIKIDKKFDVILEPFGKNTAPAVAIAANIEIHQNKHDPILLVMPSDHVVGNIELFQKKIKEAISIAEDGKLVVFGVKPKGPSPNYGYIIPSDKKIRNGFYVEKFIEKPSVQTAQKLIHEDSALFNSGIFMFKSSVFLDELKEFSPQIYDICKVVSQNLIKENNFSLIPSDIFNECPDDSIDYSVMENTKKGVVIELESFWSDLGTWDSVAEIAQKDTDNNTSGKNIFLKDSKNNFIMSDKFIVGLGIQDLFIIDSSDSILISNRDNLNNIKDVISVLKKEKRKEINNNFKDFRPWGWFENILENELYKVKRLCIYNNSRISLQKHSKRSEHWVVVSGIATVTKGKDIFDLHAGQSVFIELGEVHRIENKHSQECIIIETQLGECVEDDIVRYEDDFNRA